MRVLSSIDAIDAGHSVAMSAEAAHLRQEARHRTTLSEARGGPSSGRVVTAPSRSDPVRRDQQRHRCRQAHDAALATRRRFPDYEAEYARRGWKMVPRINRVYVNERARSELGWKPRYDFQLVVNRLRAGEDVRSPLARKVGSKGYL